MKNDITISVVIPVCRGECTLAGVVGEVLAVGRGTTDGERVYSIDEVALVWDHGGDGSPNVMRDLEQRSDGVRTVWLTRNFGQHAAMLAGIASSGSECVVTMDEDRQHDLGCIPATMRESVGL